MIYRITESTHFDIQLEDGEHTARAYDLLAEYLQTGEPVGVTQSQTVTEGKLERVTND